MERKPDDLAIGAFFDELASQPWLGYRRRRWPEFFFHVTDVQNAASILSSGRLLCRNRAVAESLMVTDNASSEVLEQSGPWLFDQVRLYFRPRTPTFWRNEGIRPDGYREYDAHCPVPVALLFDAKSIAGRIGVQFSDGNLASHAARLGEDIAFLRSLDFREIYHDGWMPEQDVPRLRLRIQAEVIIPEQIGLDALKSVVTRSAPERQTLQTLLSERVLLHQVPPETIAVDPNLFHCRWTYIERVAFDGSQVRVLFNPDSQTPGPFAARLVWSIPETHATSIATHSIRGLGDVASAGWLSRRFGPPHHSS